MLDTRATQWYYLCMGIKKIKKAIKAYANEAYEEGYYHGSDHADFQFDAGIKAERKRIIALFKMLSDNELEHGSGNKAKFWKDAADTVKIADDFEVFDEEGNPVDYDHDDF